MSFSVECPDPEDAQRYSSAAAAGDPEALYRMGRCHYYGAGIKEHKPTAMQCWRFAMERGHLDAQCSFGRALMLGDAGEKDEVNGLQYIRHAAENNCVRAQCMLAELLIFSGQEQAEGLVWARKAADLGFTHAFYLLFYCYEKGIGTTQDHRQALKWLKKAVEGGDPHAQTQLGLFYYSGHEVAQDLSRARNLFECAATKHQTDSLYYLGLIHFYGKSVPTNRVKGVEYFQLASELGHGLAYYRLGKCHRLGWGVRKNRKLALGCFQRAQNAGVAGCAYHIFMTDDLSSINCVLLILAVIALITASVLVEIKWQTYKLNQVIFIGGIFLAFLAPLILEYYFELRAVGMRLQFGILDLWIGMLGLLPSFLYCRHVSLSFTANIAAGVFAAAFLFLAQGCGYLWGILRAQVTGTSTTRPWYARLDAVIRQVLVGVGMMGAWRFFGFF